MPRLRIALALPLLLAPLAACGGEEPDAADGADGTGDESATATAEAGPCTFVASGDPAKPVDPPASDPEAADSLVVTTDQGELTFTLDADAAPCAAGSFTSLAEQGYFDDTECHRLTTAGIFVLQCGDPTGTGAGGPGYSFADELSGSETYPAGTLAMANAGTDTNGSQFFIVYKNTRLPPYYTVFGSVDDAGLAVVRQVAEAGSDDSNGPGDGAPKERVVIESVS